MLWYSRLFSSTNHYYPSQSSPLCYVVPPVQCCPVSVGLSVLWSLGCSSRRSTLLVDRLVESLVGNNPILNDDVDNYIFTLPLSSQQDKYFKPVVTRFLASVSRAAIQSSHTVIHYSLFNLGARHLIRTIRKKPVRASSEHPWVL